MAGSRPMTRFLVGFDLIDLRHGPYPLHQAANFPYYEAFLRDHDCHEDVIYESSYDDPTRLGRCRRPLERCDLTCPEPELIGPLPYMDPSDEPPF